MEREREKAKIRKGVQCSRKQLKLYFFVGVKKETAISNFDTGGAINIAVSINLFPFFFLKKIGKINIDVRLPTIVWALLKKIKIKKG